MGGKGHWVEVRDDFVNAKGKGVLKTYWVTPSTMKKDQSATFSLPPSAELDAESPVATSSADLARRERLIDWIVELLKEYILKMIAKRQSQGKPVRSKTGLFAHLDHKSTPIDDVVEMIHLPAFDKKSVEGRKKSSKVVEVSEEALKELRDYVAGVAATYHPNAFHNFEHACHVTMSVHKFLQRVTSPDIDAGSVGGIVGEHAGGIASQLHDYTHGINSIR